MLLYCACRCFICLMTTSEMSVCTTPAHSHITTSAQGGSGPGWGTLQPAAAQQVVHASISCWQAVCCSRQLHVGTPAQLLTLMML
jgi:hypothetical protein